MTREFLTVAVMNAGLVMAMMTALWGLSVVIKDSSIADIFWGLGFVFIVSFTTTISDGSEERRALVSLLTTVWGVRLAGYIGWRNWGAEDSRYARLRQHVESQGKSYTLHSLIYIYWVQGFYMWLVSLVLIFAMTMDSPEKLGMLAHAGVAVWIVGMAFETIGDMQLARFLGDTDNAGKVLDTGLWRYTRHPNYFGEACVWLGFFLIAIESIWGLMTVISLATIYYALLGPTGKGLLERRMSKKRPDFEIYKQRTSGFFPLPPKSL
jgi:steroid 5-alpha reductase family enzyme